mmetsp:Transcript_31294/g.65447  ORF Transcript_31294/g.65447 Transcript_31294/m.65447 type:complete len:230 (+) Transcript_31294:1208-1897(+)
MLLSQHGEGHQVVSISQRGERVDIPRASEWGGRVPEHRRVDAERKLPAVGRQSNLEGKVRRELHHAHLRLRLRWHRHRLGVSRLRTPRRNRRRRGQLRAVIAHGSIRPRRLGRTDGTILRPYGRVAVRSGEHCQSKFSGGGGGVGRIEFDDVRLSRFVGCRHGSQCPLVRSAARFRGGMVRSRVRRELGGEQFEQSVEGGASLEGEYRIALLWTELFGRHGIVRCSRWE